MRRHGLVVGGISLSCALACACGDNLGPIVTAGEDDPHALRLRIDGSGPVPAGGFGVLVPLAGRAARVGAGDFTIEMWVKSERDTLLAWGGCRAGYQEGTRWMYGHVLIDRSGAASRSFFGLSAYGDALSFGIGDESQVEGGVCEPAYLNDESWHHVAAVREGDAIRVYVDGESTRALRDLPAGDVSFQGEPDDPDGALLLGGWKTTNQVTPWRGWIDEFRVSTVARYPREPAPAGPFEPDEHTAVLYHFDQLGGDHVVDAADPEAGGTILEDPEAGLTIQYVRDTPFE